MAIAPVSGSSRTASVRSSEPVRNVREADDEKKSIEKKTAEQENEKKMEANKKEFEDAKGVKEVDVKV